MTRFAVHGTQCIPVPLIALRILRGLGSQRMGAQEMEIVCPTMKLNCLLNAASLADTILNMN